MGYTFEEFEKNNYHESFGDILAYRGFIQVIKELIDVQNIKYFYTKNTLNDDDNKELIFFLENKIVVAKFSNSTYTFDNINSKLQSATLLTSRYGQEQTVLSLSFSNGRELSFNSLHDSNLNWNIEYTKYLKEIYKMLLYA